MKRLWKLLNSPEFDEWFNGQTEKHKQQIRKRLSNIEMKGHFGIHKEVDKEYEIWELKWENGRRVYYVYLNESGLLLLLGGNKNGQSKDIAKAKKIFSRYK